MKKQLLLPLLFGCVGAFAQQDDASKYASTIKTTELQKHLTVIAADDMEGRETGTAGQRKAAAYIEQFFKGAGLNASASTKGYQQLYPLYKDSMISSRLTVGEKTAVFGTDYICPINANENGQFNGKEIVFAGYGIEDKDYSDYAGLNVKGKVVAIFLGEPKSNGKYLISPSTSSSSSSFIAFITI